MAQLTDGDLRRLIEAVVRALATELGALEPPAEKSPVLFLFTGAANGHDRSMELVRSVSERRPAMACIGTCYSERFGTDELVAALGSADRLRTDCSPDERDRVIDDSSAVVFLQPMRSTIAKVSRAITDSNPSQMVTRALMLAKPVFCAGGEIDAGSWPASMPEAMRYGKDSLGEIVQQYLERLASWGMIYRNDPMELFAALAKLENGGTKEMKSLPASVISAQQSAPQKSSGRGFLTANDVRRHHNDGNRTIVVPPNTIVTDEARDVASALHVALIAE